MSVPSVSVGSRRGRIYVISTYSPGPGTYVDKEPVCHTLSTDTEGIGNSVLSGLHCFQDGGSLPDWTTYRSPVLDAAGVSTWREYERGLRSCVVSQYEDHLLIRGDCSPINLPRTANREEIGSAVLAALGTSPEKELKKRRANS
jgi:hypothetical protein